MATQAIFYVQNSTNPQLSLVLHTNRRTFDDYTKQGEEIVLPPFTRGFPSVEEIDSLEDLILKLKLFDGQQF